MTREMWRWPVQRAAMVVVLLMGSSPALAQRKAEMPWWERSFEASSEYYLIKTDLPRADAQAVARHLDTMYEEYARRLASLPQRAPMRLNVYLFDSRRDYELTLRARFGVNVAKTGGVFFVSGRNHGLALWTGELTESRIKHVLQHEGFHQFAYSRFGTDLPMWVNEGLAEFFGQSVLVDGKLVIGQSHQRTLDRLKNAIEDESYITFDEMVSMTPQRWNEILKLGKAGLLYDQAWSMVYSLVYAENGRWTDAFERYLKLINNGVASREAFFKAFETSETDAFEEKWKQYVKSSRPSAFVTALERIEFLAEGARELARREVYPESLEALRHELQAIDFSYRLTQHGREILLRAKQEELYLIPLDDLSRHQPVFEVSRPNLRMLTRKQRLIELEHPSPSIITTQHLEPKSLEVVFLRQSEDKADEGSSKLAFRYRIKVK